MENSRCVAPKEHSICSFPLRLLVLQGKAAMIDSHSFVGVSKVSPGPKGTENNTDMLSSRRTLS